MSIFSSDLITKNFMNGCQLILKYQPNARIVIGQHDTIYFGQYNGEDMNEEDWRNIRNWGWYEEEESWAINL